jgi:hypothetical protein
VKLRQLLLPLAALAALALPVGAHGAPPQTLRLADMPSGWTQEVVSPTSSTSCGFNLQRPAKAEFASSASLPDSVTSAAKAFGRAGVARRMMLANHAKARTCQVRGWRTKLMSFPRIGEQSFALRLTGTVSGVSVTGEMVFFRRGARVGAVTLIGVGSGNVYLLEELARKGLRRLGTL